MMKKYGVEENQVYVEQSTLLEPNNFIPSWVGGLASADLPQEAGDEEKKEVSNALRKLRMKFDGIHQLAADKEIQLELLKVVGFFY